MAIAAIVAWRLREGLAGVSGRGRSHQVVSGQTAQHMLPPRLMASIAKQPYLHLAVESLVGVFWRPGGGRGARARGEGGGGAGGVGGLWHFGWAAAAGGTRMSRTTTTRKRKARVEGGRVGERGRMSPRRRRRTTMRRRRRPRTSRTRRSRSSRRRRGSTWGDPRVWERGGVREGVAGGGGRLRW